MLLTSTQLVRGKASHRSLIGQNNHFALKGDSQSFLTFSQRALHGFFWLSFSAPHSGTTTRHMTVAMWGEQAVSTIWPICCRLKPWTPSGWRVEVYPKPWQKLAVTGLQLVPSLLLGRACWGNSRHTTTKNKRFMVPMHNSGLLQSCKTFGTTVVCVGYGILLRRWSTNLRICFHIRGNDLRTLVWLSIKTMLKTNWAQRGALLWEI